MKFIEPFYNGQEVMFSAPCSMRPLYAIIRGQGKERWIDEIHIWYNGQPHYTFRCKLKGPHRLLDRMLGLQPR